MSIVISDRLVQAASPFIRPRVVRVIDTSTYTVRLSVLAQNAFPKNNLEIAENADRSFTFKYPSNVDISGALEIEFRVWENFGGSELLFKNLTGGAIVLPTDNSYSVAISDVESAAMTPGTHYYETWVTASDNRRHPVSAGKFTVIDTRNFD